MALSKKSKSFLTKLKAQQGLQVPYIDMSGMDAFQDYYSINAPNNIEQNLQPNLEAAKNATVLRDNPQTRGKISFMSNPNQGYKMPSLSVPTDAKGYVGGGYGENDATDFADAVGESGLPFLSGWFTSVNGIRDMVYSYEDEERQRAYEKSSMEDLKQRKDQARANNFYFTPYTTGRTSFKSGGKIGKYQGGGMANSIDLFMNYYNEKEQESKQSIDRLQEYYTSKNNFMRDQWMERRTKGLSNHIMGGIDSFLDYWTYGADGQSMNAGTISEAQSSIQTTDLGKGMQKGGYIPTVTPDKGIISTATVFDSNKPIIKKDSLLQELENTVRDTTLQNRLNKMEYDLETEKQVKLIGEWNKLTPYQREYYGKLRAGVPINEEDGSPSNKHKRFRYREKQEGGEIDQEPDTESLYSKDFVSPWEEDEKESQQLQDRIYADNPGMSFENNNNLNQWLFGEDEPVQKYTINDIYNQQYSQQESQEVLPVKPVIDQFQKMGIGIGSINTGQHNPGSRHYQGRAFDIPGSKNGGREGLYKIYNYLNSPEGKRQFPNIKVINEIDAPAGKIGTANHIHVELIN